MRWLRKVTDTLSGWWRYIHWEDPEPVEEPALDALRKVHAARYREADFDDFLRVWCEVARLLVFSPQAMDPMTDIGLRAQDLHPFEPGQIIDDIDEFIFDESLIRHLKKTRDLRTVHDVISHVLSAPTYRDPACLRA